MTPTSGKRTRAGKWSATIADIAQSTGHAVISAADLATRATQITGRHYSRATIGRLVARGKLPKPVGYAPLPTQRDPETGRALYSGVFDQAEAQEWLRGLAGQPDALIHELERRFQRRLVLDDDVMRRLADDLGVTPSARTIQRWTTAGQFPAPVTRVRRRTVDGTIHSHAAYDLKAVDTWFDQRQAGQRKTALHALRNRRSNDLDTLIPLVRTARASGVLWREIADLLGVSVQAAAARFGRHI